MKKYTRGLCQKFIEILNEKLLDQAESYTLIKDANQMTATCTRLIVIRKYEKEYVRKHIEKDYDLDISDQEEHKALKSVLAAAMEHLEKFDHIK